MTAVRILAVQQGAGVGGAPVSLLKLLARLDRAVFSSKVLFAEAGPSLGLAARLGLPAESVPTGGALFYSAHARPGVRGLARFIRTFPAAVATAQRVLRQQRPDVLHLNTSVLLAWGAAARRERVPVVWLVREVLGANPWLRRWHAHFLASHARVLVAISESVRECFAAERDVRVVYNAVDLEEFSSEQYDAAAVRTALGLGQTAYLVFMLGSVQREKGHWLMLDALARLGMAEARLVLVTGGVGEGYARSMKGRVKRALGMSLDNLDALRRDALGLGVWDKVQVTGFVTDVARLLSAADVLVFPSLAPEGFGRPIIEAMAMARPVVATDIGPSRELLGIEAGTLVPPTSVAVAEALRELLESQARRAELGRAGRARAEACFSLDRQVAAMSDIYREAAR